MRNFNAMKYFNIVLLLGLVIILAVSFWPKNDDSSEPPEAPSEGQEQTLEARAAEYGIELKGSLDPEYGQNYTFALETLFHKEGELLLTVTEAEIITNINDLPEGTLFDPTVSVEAATGPGGLSVKDYIHPYSPEEDAGSYAGDFVLEDGSFIPDVYMVILNIRIENRDASCYVVGEDKTHPAFCYDPYIFWVTQYVELRDIGNETFANNLESQFSFSPDFSSDFGINSAPPDTESGLALTIYEEGVRVEPGEVRDITMGYLVCPIAGHFAQPEDLCVLIGASSGSPNNPGVYLSLQWPEGTEGNG